MSSVNISDLFGSNVRVNLSAHEILKLADQIIARSKEVHDIVASIPLDKVNHLKRFPIGENICSEIIFLLMRLVKNAFDWYLALMLFS